ncbi:MAG: transcriptional regulator domain-containing protein [Nitrospiraceae bacterium]
MTKKEQEGETRRALQLYCLHRECVRRNPDYMKTYRDFDTEKEPKVREDKEHGLRFRWRLSFSDPLPHPDEHPDLSHLKNGLLAADCQNLTPMTDVDSLENAAAAFLTKHLLYPNRMLLETVANELKGFLCFLYFPEERDHNFPASWSLTTLDMRRTKNEITQFCNAWLEDKLAKRKEYDLKQQQPRMRLRVDEGFDYLRAYDLRRKGKKLREIAGVLWPSGDSTKQTRLVKTYCDKGKSLVHVPPLLRLVQEHRKARLRNS